MSKIRTITWPAFFAHKQVKMTLLAHAAAAAILTILWVSKPAQASAMAAAIVSLILLFHLVIILAAVWPRSQVLGTNFVRLSPIACQRQLVSLTFDDGPNAQVTPRVLDLLDQYQAQASFFCIANKLHEPAMAALAQEIVERGHTLENHSYSHPVSFSFRGLRGLQAEIDQAQNTIAQCCGSAPNYFRAPAGIRNPLLQPLLDLKGLALASWTRRGYDTRSTDPNAVYLRLVRNLAAGDILLLHDGNSTLTRDGEVLMLVVLEKLLQELQARGLTSVSLPTGLSIT
jgi:peptidoglycan-N-acetylglucosamine deacetylase